MKADIMAQPAEATSGIINIAVYFGLNSALLTFMIITYVKTVAKLMDVIDRNSQAMGKVSEVVEKCKK